MPVTTGLQKVAFGANTQISYLVQTAAGAIDDDPAWTVVPFASGEMTFQAEQMNDTSMTGDRNELEPRSGTVNGQMTLSGKFRPECLDDLIEAAAQGTWAVKYALTALTITVASETAGFSFTRSDAEGSWIADGVEVGDIMIFSGFTDPTYAANNTTLEVTAVTSATVLQFANATGLDTCTDETGVAATTGANYLKVGSTQRRVAWEIHHSDAGTAGEYVRMVDTEISNFSLSLQANGEVTFDMTAIGGTELDLGAAIDDAIADATYTETTKPFYDSFNGTVSLAGETGIYFSSMTPTINNQSTPLFALGSRYPFAIAHGKMMGDMSLTAYYSDETIKAKYQDEDSLNLKVSVKYEDEDLIDTDFHEFEWPSTKILTFGRPIGGEGELVDNLTVKPYKDTTLESAFRIRKYNAA